MQWWCNEIKFNWSNQMIRSFDLLIFLEKINLSSRSWFATSSTHLIISTYHSTASPIFQHLWICKSSVERFYFFRFDVFYEQRIFESENFEDENFWKFSLTSRDFLHSELRLSDVKKLSRLTPCHEVWLLIILRMRKPCINDKKIAKIMIIREEFYSKNVMWSVLRYSTCSDHSHILIWRWIILIELIWWFQSLSRNSIIIRARNLIIRLTTYWFIYLSIKSAVNTYIYHKMMKY
jgi:hypothetical protein